MRWRHCLQGCPRLELTEFDLGRPRMNDELERWLEKCRNVTMRAVEMSKKCLEDLVHYMEQQGIDSSSA